MSKYFKITGYIDAPDDMNLDEIVYRLTDTIEEKGCSWCVLWEDVTEEYRKRNTEVSEDGD